MQGWANVWDKYIFYSKAKSYEKNNISKLFMYIFNLGNKICIIFIQFLDQIGNVIVHFTS